MPSSEHIRIGEVINSTLQAKQLQAARVVEPNEPGMDCGGNSCAGCQGACTRAASVSTQTNFDRARRTGCVRLSTCLNSTWGSLRLGGRAGDGEGRAPAGDGGNRSRHPQRRPQVYRHAPHREAVVAWLAGCLYQRAHPAARPRQAGRRLEPNEQGAQRGSMTWQQTAMPPSRMPGCLPSRRHKSTHNPSHLP